MRPVKRGDAPGRYDRYADAVDDLHERLGGYCSYCEQRCSSRLAVEHKAPKSIHPDLELEWTNLLLGCRVCNSTKGDKDVDDRDVLWPDRDNTLLAFAYARGGFVRVAEGLRSDVKRRAEALIDLVGLDRHPAAHCPSPSGADRRWRLREEVWSTAMLSRELLERTGWSLQTQQLVLIAARGWGFFSVWFTVFERWPAMRRALIAAFPGTSGACFDQVGNPLPRPGGAI